MLVLVGGGSTDTDSETSLGGIGVDSSEEFDMKFAALNPNKFYIGRQPALSSDLTLRRWPIVGLITVKSEVLASARKCSQFPITMPTEVGTTHFTREIEIEVVQKPIPTWLNRLLI